MSTPSRGERFPSAAATIWGLRAELADRGLAVAGLVAAVVAAWAFVAAFAGVVR